MKTALLVFSAMIVGDLVGGAWRAWSKPSAEFWTEMKGRLLIGGLMLLVFCVVFASDGIGLLGGEKNK